ncbi:MAG TPA: hypothetical protein VH591_00105, partial [Ktedonobacterales bacterium]
WTPSNVTSFAAGVYTIAAAITFIYLFIDSLSLRLLTLPVIGPVALGNAVGMLISTVGIVGADLIILNGIGDELSLIGGEG